MANHPFWVYWYFHIPNYLAALVMYTLIGRFFLTFLFSADAPNYIWRGFRFITDWAVAAVRFLTPQYVMPLFLPLIGAFWLFLLRHIYYVILANAGAAPTAGLQ
jgi:YggT family protein